MFKGYGGGRPPPPGAPRPSLPALPSAVRPGSQQQKFQPDPTAGSSATTAPFVPNLNTITSSHNLQWMVQPSLMGASSGLPPPFSRPYRCPHYAAGIRPGVIRTTGPGMVPRRRHSEHLTPEEEERRRLRRERNKMAAAKCRNRRKELTDTLQAETDQLEAEQSGLRKEIAELQKQKDRLELVLEAHRPVCKILEESSGDEDGSCLRPRQASPPSQLPPDKQESPPGPRSGSRRTALVPPSITLPPSGLLEPESLHTPTLMSTPSFTPFTPSLVFTYPAPGDPDGPSVSGFPAEACSSAHRRSSSGDHSSDSLNSPTLLAL